VDSARASLATACDDEGGMLCSIAEESSGVSWELIEGVLRRLQEEKGEDIMATDIDSQISGRDYIGHCDCDRKQAQGPMHGIASTRRRMRYSDDAKPTDVRLQEPYAGTAKVQAVILLEVY
jgi:hypothetical protein